MRLLEKRVALEEELIKVLRTHIRETFNKIVELGYAEQIEPMMFRFSHMRRKEELTELLEELRMFLYMIAEEYSQQAVDMVERQYGSVVPLEIHDYINEKKNDKTLKQRIAIYTERFKMEAEGWIATGLLLSMTASALKKEFDLNAAHPYSDPYFIKASNITLGRNSATRLVTKGISYGVGLYVGAENALVRLERYTLADAFRLAQFFSFASRDGLIGYYIGRGSSYPCETCDDETGFRPLGFEQLPPYHANCKCWAAPVYM